RFLALRPAATAFLQRPRLRALVGHGPGPASVRRGLARPARAGSAPPPFTPRGHSASPSSLTRNRRATKIASGRFARPDKHNPRRFQEQAAACLSTCPAPRTSRTHSSEGGTTGFWTERRARPTERQREA